MRKSIPPWLMEQNGMITRSTERQIHSSQYGTIKTILALVASFSLLTVAMSFKIFVRLSTLTREKGFQIVSITKEKAFQIISIRVA